MIAPVPDLTVELPRGFLAQGGVRHTEVEVRELNGADEERLARYKSEEEVYNAIIAMSVVRIGTVDLSSEPLSAKEPIVSSLLLGERSLIFLKASEATFGNERDLAITCGSCETEQETTILVDHDFPLIFPAGEDEELQDTYDYKLRTGQVVTYRLPIGSDIVDMASLRSIPERSSLLLTKIILNVDGRVPADINTFVKTMGMADRRLLVEDVDSKAPFVDLTVKTQCIACEEEVTIPMTWGQFLQP